MQYWGTFYHNSQCTLYTIIPKSAISRKYETKSGIFGYCVKVRFSILGPPGAGKSTTGQLMGRKSNYVYFEADCSSQFLNPYIDVNIENPTMAGMSQAPVKVTELISFIESNWIKIV